MMSLQTGVDPEALQAARKTQKKVMEKAKSTKNPSLKLCGTVSAASRSFSLRLLYTAGMLHICRVVGL